MASRILARGEGSWTLTPSPSTHCQLTSPALLGGGQGGPGNQTQGPRAVRTGVWNLSAQAQLARSLVSLGCLPQKEQEQTTAAGDSPVSLLAVPTPGPAQDSPAYLPRGLETSPPHGQLLRASSPAPPLCATIRVQWGGGGGVVFAADLGSQSRYLCESIEATGAQTWPKVCCPARHHPPPYTRQHPFSLISGTERSLSFLHLLPS